MKKPKQIDEYDPHEARRRFDAALRGAFNTPPTPMKDIPPKRAQKSPGKSAAPLIAPTPPSKKP